MSKDINKQIADEFIITSFGSLVLLFTWKGEFINVWHATNLDRKKPGTLDIMEHREGVQ